MTTGLLKKGLLMVLVVLAGIGSYAQQVVPDGIDSFANKLSYYARQKEAGLLFAHFDKNIYGNNEHVWFTAYSLKGWDRDLDSVVSVILISAAGQKIILEDRFLMANGISAGHLVLPDSIPTGGYSFVLYTDKTVKGDPRDFFIQRVYIRNTNKSPAASPSAGATKNVTADGEKSVMAEKPAKVERPDVRFYPEGGSLSAGLVNAIGWESKTTGGRPLQARGILYKEGLAIDTVETSPYGMGVFRLKPETGSHYRLLLAGSEPGGRGFADSPAAFDLPPIVTDRPVIAIPEALAGDTLKLTISNCQTAKYFLAIHNYDDLFFFLAVQTGPAGKAFQIALTDLPKGIASITVLDSLQRPCAERLFFAHYDRRNPVSILTDRGSYGAGDSVSLRLNLRSADGQPAYGLVSVAVVQASRLSLRNKNDIESWWYLQHPLGALPFKEDYLGYHRGQEGGPRSEDKSYLEDLLRIKGWRNYSWVEAVHAVPADTLIRYDSLQLHGSVTCSGKPLKKPVTVLLMRGGELGTLETDAKGAFRIPFADLFARESQKVYLLVNGDKSGSCKISTFDALESVGRSVSARMHPGSAPDLPAPDPHAGIENEKGWRKASTLKEVVVTARSSQSFYAARKRVNACGDYVCRYGFLNCPYHGGDFDNIAPVSGKAYKIFDGSGADGVEIFHSVVYQGCVVKKPESGAVMVKGILFVMDFYREDSSGDPATDDFISTLYWKHLYKIGQDGDPPIRFHTGHITGPFKIIVQGIGVNDVLYGEGSLLVR